VSTAPTSFPKDLTELYTDLAEMGALWARISSALARLLCGDRLAEGRIADPGHGPESHPVPQPPDSQFSVADWARKAAEENEALAKAGKLKVGEFTADSPAEAAAGRLKRIARERGISQKAIATKLGVTPAAVNRVFKRPDRSKVATLRKIAAAMGVALHELI